MDIYVGKLHPSTTEENLRILFEEYGQVTSVKIVKDRETGQARGFAFVQMPSADQAQEAMAQLNGKDVNGSYIIVNEARQREQRGDFRSRPRFGGDRGGNGFGSNRSGGNNFRGGNNGGSRW